MITTLLQRPFALFLALCALVPFLLVPLLAPPPAMAAESDAVVSPRATVRLITDSDIAVPGGTVGAGLDFELTDGWHVYWRNPGDSGLPPRFEWVLPPRWSAGDIAWPVPESIAVGPFVNFGYSHRVLLAAPLQVPAKARLGDTVTLKLDATWLVCEEACIPEEGSFELSLPVASAAFAAAPQAKRFRETAPDVPRAVPGVESTFSMVGDDRIEVRISLPEDLPVSADRVTFFPASESVVEPSAPQTVRKEGDTLILGLELSSYAEKPVQRLDGLVVAYSAPADGGTEAGPSADRLAFEITAGANPDASSGIDAEGVPAGSASGPSSDTTGAPSLLGALAFAFLGGLLLNLMPCVFPVISIKILSFVEGADDPRRARRHGWLFAAGVVLSFLVLAAILLALRGAGEEIGWGFHLQSPLMLGALSLLFFLAGLSFLGVFEIGGTLAGRVASVAAGSGRGAHRDGTSQKGSSQSSSWGAFGSGALATLVATPCTAPFMGAALGVALLLDPMGALAIFAALGLGMAAPYVLLSHLPALAARLPKPGPWMETFKQILAFPLFATVVWLAWVLAGVAGPTGVAGLLGALVLAGFGAWLLGRFGGPAAPPRRRRWATAGALAAVALALACVIPGLVLPATATASLTTSGINGSSATAPGGLEWIPFAPGVVEDLRAQGRAVYVDFTAAWCLTCQVNKTVVFSSDEVVETFRQRDIALVRADWTRRNPDITRALAAFGRSGVPLNVYYPASPDAAPELLPAVLTPSIVLETLGSP